jgi:hypothetical protein
MYVGKNVVENTLISNKNWLSYFKQTCYVEYN